MLGLTPYARRTRTQPYIPPDAYSPYLYPDYPLALAHYPRRAPTAYASLFNSHRASTPPSHLSSSSWTTSSAYDHHYQQDPANCIEDATRAHVAAKSEYDKAKEKYEEARKKFEECEGRLKECVARLQRAKLARYC